MRRYITTLLILALLSSCKKDELPLNCIPDSPPNSYIENTPGSYFIYEWFEINNLGQEVSLGYKDSTYIVGDTTINGNVYVHIKGTYLGNQQNWFFRDSSNFIVNQTGSIQWTENQIQDTLETNFLNSNIVAYSIYEPNATFTFPDGIWNGNLIIGQVKQTFDLQVHYYNIDGTPFTSCDSNWISHKLFLNGIGEVLSQTAYSSQLYTECTYLERRLIYYNIIE